MHCLNKNDPYLFARGSAISFMIKEFNNLGDIQWIKIYYIDNSTEKMSPASW